MAEQQGQPGDAADQKRPAKIKDAELIDASGKLPTRKLSTGEQFLVAVLVVVVGILFSMTAGGPIGLLDQLKGGQQQKGSGGITRREAEAMIETHIVVEAARQGIGTVAEFVQMDAMMAQWSRRGSQIPNWQNMTHRMWLARMAEERGLAARGTDLDRLEQSLLAELNRDGKTMREALAPFDAEETINRKALRDYLQMQRSYETISEHITPTPLVPAAVGAAVAASGRDELDLVTVRLSAALVADTQKEAVTDSELNQEYLAIRDEHFRVPANRQVVAIAALPSAFAEAHFVSQERIQKFYDDNKERWRKPDEPAKPDGKPAEAAGADKGPDAAPKPEDKTAEPPKPPVPSYKPLDDVLGEIRAEIESSDRRALATELRQRFDAAAEAACAARAITPDQLNLEEMRTIAAGVKLAQADHADRLKADVGLLISPDQVLLQPLLRKNDSAKRTVALTGLGSAEVSIDPQSLFDERDAAGTWVETVRLDGDAEEPRILLHLGAYTPSTTQPLDAVRDQVALSVAGRKAWSALVAKANEARDLAQAAGGLETYFGNADNAAQWKTSVETLTERDKLMRILPPGAEPSTTVNPGELAIALIRPDQPILVAGKFATSDGKRDWTINDFLRDVEGKPAPASVVESLPQVMLVQRAAFRPAAKDAEKAQRDVDGYRYAITSFQHALVMSKLNQAEAE